MKTMLSILSALLLLSQVALAQAQSETTAKIDAALKLDYRGDADRERDRNRRPKRALKYMGFEHDMKVFEFGPGAGWYTKILAPVLADRGELIVGYPEAWLADLGELRSSVEYKNVREVDMAMGWNEEELVFSFEEIDFDAEKLDMFLNIRNYHNLSEADRAGFNEAVYDALKPGGIYVVIDHTRRHMQPDDYENWRREDPVKALTEIQAAGFELEKYSNMFYRPDDTLQFEVGRKTVTGNTDRFFFVFKKP